MHRVALALLKRYETVIASSSQPAVMLKILDMRISRLTDVGELMQVRGISRLTDVGELMQVCGCPCNC